MILPDKLTSQAFKSANGELAWLRDQLPEVVAEYARQGHAVEGFEVWLVDDSGKWTGIIPVTNSNVPSVCVYDVKSIKSTETRAAFIARCAKEIQEKVAEWNMEGSVTADLRPRIRYNLYIEEEYTISPFKRKSLLLSCAKVLAFIPLLAFTAIIYLLICGDPQRHKFVYIFRAYIIPAAITNIENSCSRISINGVSQATTKLEYLGLLPHDNYTGVWTTWHLNGNKRSEIFYRNGHWDGISCEWYENGELFKVEGFAEGIQHGALLECVNGNLFYEIHFNHGKVDGPQIQYDLDGNKHREVIHNNGIETSEKQWDRARNDCIIGYYDAGKKHHGAFVSDLDVHGSVLAVDYYEDGILVRKETRSPPNVFEHKPTINYYHVLVHILLPLIIAILVCPYIYIMLYIQMARSNTPNPPCRSYFMNIGYFAVWLLIYTFSHLSSNEFASLPVIVMLLFFFGLAISTIYLTFTKRSVYHNGALLGNIACFLFTTIIYILF